MPSGVISRAQTHSTTSALRNACESSLTGHSDPRLEGKGLARETVPGVAVLCLCVHGTCYKNVVRTYGGYGYGQSTNIRMGVVNDTHMYSTGKATGW